MHKRSLTKKICTIGPASWDPTVLSKMYEAGMDVGRINMSFADADEVRRVSKLLRDTSPDIVVLVDLMGHKVRVTGFDEDKLLIDGQRVKLVPAGQPIKDEDTIAVTYKRIAKDVSKGVKILIDDGNLQLTVEKVSKNTVHCIVTEGGVLKRRKTVNIPGVHLHFPSLTPKDKEDIKAAVANKADVIAASFVRDAHDVRMVKREIAKNDPDIKIPVVAKIEDMFGVQNYSEILEEVDGIMVARGDLGVELPAEEIPILQKRFIKEARERGRWVIVATQMLESMREHSRPTRAEVSDVANAVMDYADAVMLSAESSMGKFPVKAVETLNKIAYRVEQDLPADVVGGRTDATQVTDILMSHVPCDIATLDIKGIVMISKTGSSVSSLARHRLNIPIWHVSKDQRLVIQKNMVRGIRGILGSMTSVDHNTIARKVVQKVYKVYGLSKDDKVAVITGSTLATRFRNAIVEVATVGEILGM